MRSARIKAFTLLELLVTLAVVGIIAALLLTAFSRARESGRRTTCQSNLRQIALAMQQYVADSDGQYPISLYAVKKGGVNVGVSWQQVIFPYLKDARLLHCPDYPADAPDRAGITSLDSLQLVDYDYNNVRLNTFRPPFPTVTVTGTHEAVLVNPATIWLNVDKSWSTLGSSGAFDDYHYQRPVTSSCGRVFIGSTLHAGGGNYSFLDGHVGWLTPEAMGEVECSNGPLPFPFKD